MKRAIPGALFLALGGCTNLQAVSEISKHLTSASGSWRNVGQEIQASCERMQRLNADVTDCKTQAAAAQGLSDATAVLTSYFGALGAGANEANFTVQPGLDAAAASVNRIPGVTQDQVNAVSGLVGLLARQVSGRMREETLRELIGEGAPLSQEIIAGLEDLAVQDLQRQLNLERIQLAGHFIALIAAERDTIMNRETLCRDNQSSGFSGTGLLLTLEYCDRRRIVDERDKALEAYRASLAKASEALEELQSSRTQLRSRELAAQLYSTGSELKDKVDALQTAFD